MTERVLKIGTRESQLAVWQATQVKALLQSQDIKAELVYIKSEGDIDLKTPLYELGVQGIFTRSLDVALLNGAIDLAVHSMKDVPTRLPKGIVQAAVLERASPKDLLVYNEGNNLFERLGYSDKGWVNLGNETKHNPLPLVIGTSSVRRIAQWLNRYPGSDMQNLRGNVNTRLKKLASSNWDGAIFAAAGLERIDLRPKTSIELDWMLPAPAQGAIVVVCRQHDDFTIGSCIPLNHAHTALCTRLEKDFLRTLMGGCTTPISAFAQVAHNNIVFNGNVISPDGQRRLDVYREAPLTAADDIGVDAANEILANGGKEIVDAVHGAR